MHIPSTDGVTLALHDLGGTGEPLLIAHATGFCGQTYVPLTAALASSFHVWALDFRGHGDSTAPEDGDFSWVGMGADASAAIDAISDGGLVAFGHSMGGAALLLAELARPGALRSVFLYEPIIFPSRARLPGPDNPMATAARRRRRTFPSKGAALLRYAARTPLGVLRADALAAYVEHGFADDEDGTATLKCAPESEAATFEAEGKVSVEQVAGLALTTTVGAGRSDGGDPAAFAPAIVDAMPEATLRSYPRLGHFGPLQDPDLIAEDMLAVAGRAR